jgi:hypothetical protein
MKPPKFEQADLFFFVFFLFGKVARDFTLSCKEFHNFIVEGKKNLELFADGISKYHIYHYYRNNMLLSDKYWEAILFSVNHSNHLTL